MGHTIDAHMGEGGGGGKVLKFGHKNAIKHLKGPPFIF
jgi:hypothetical protein